MTTPIPRENWSVELDRFTRRNAGRRVVLEIDEPAVGAQRVIDSCLWGVAYDGRDDEVDLLFGDFEGGRARLTHTVGAPLDIETLAWDDGGDRVLRVAYAGGQALLHVDRPAR